MHTKNEDRVPRLRLEKSRFGDGEKIVIYDSPEEEAAALHHYRKGELSALTCEEIEFFRSCASDPNCSRWQAERAGAMADDVDELDFNGLVFVHDLGRTFEEGREMLLGMVGKRPITNLTVWELNRELNARKTNSRAAEILK